MSDLKKDSQAQGSKPLVRTRSINPAHAALANVRAGGSGAKPDNTGVSGTRSSKKKEKDGSKSKASESGSE